MKRITVIVIVIAALLVAGFAATQYFNKKKSSQKFSITGEWRLDSLAVSDSSSQLVNQLLIAMDDTTGKEGIRYHFHPDSTLQKIFFKDSVTEKYYLRDSVLYVNEGKGFLPYGFTIVSDSLIQLRNADSALFILKRK